MFDFKIDETSLQINHYFKRKTALLSTPGHLTLLLGVSKVCLILWRLAKDGLSFDLSETGMGVWLQWNLAFDLACIANILVQMCFFIFFLVFTRLL